MKRLVVVLSVLFSMIVVPQANAAGYWYAGNLYADYNRGGASQGVFFKHVGECDSWGYSFDLQNGSQLYDSPKWSTTLSSFGVSNYNGCNAVKIYMFSDPNRTWVCDAACLKGTNYFITLGGGFNDNVGKIRFFKG